MAIWGNLLALIAPGKLELYAADNACPSPPRKFWSCELSHCIGHADLSFNAIPKSQTTCDQLLRVCVSEAKGLFVYDIVIPIDSGSATQHERINLRRVWFYEPDEYTDALRPCFDATLENVSWLEAKQQDWTPVAFVTSSIPQIMQDTSNPQAVSLPRPYKLSNFEMPALYCAGVRDYDATRGILVLGSAFGELALYDFSGSETRQLEDCFYPIPHSATGSEELMPRVRITGLHVF